MAAYVTVAGAGKVSERRGLGYWTAIGFGSGLFPVFAGTFGTIPMWVAAYFVSQQWAPGPWAFVVAAVVVTLIGFWAASSAEEILGHDPKSVVIDEWAGMLIALIGVAPTFGPFLWAFFFFRLFDVLKLFPARQMERLPRGYGVVMDDVVAGVQALVVYHALHYFWPGVF